MSESRKLYARAYRASMTPLEKEAYRFKQNQWRKNWLAKKTPQQRAAYYKQRRRAAAKNKKSLLARIYSCTTIEEVRRLINEKAKRSLVARRSLRQ